MKTKHCPSLIFIVFVFVSLLSTVIKVNAINTRFSTEELTEKYQSVFISNINISSLASEPAKKIIHCFDVNEKGMIAIGSNSNGQEQICIYSSEGVFLYGYNFDCSGDFCVEWYNDHLNICLIRSDVIITVDKNANIIEMAGIQDTIDNNTLFNRFMYSTNRNIKNNEYILKNNMGILNAFATGYSQISIKDVENIETVVYEVDFIERIKAVIIPILVIFSCLLAVFCVLIWNRYHNLRYNRQSAKLP